MKERKIVNILMWIPIVNLFVGIYEISHIKKGDTWFQHVGIFWTMINGAYVGAFLGALLCLF